MKQSERPSTRAHKDRVLLAPRENPLRVPIVLLDAADSPLVDQLGMVLQYIDELPPELLDALQKHLVFPESVADLRNLWKGMLGLRKNILPTNDELAIIGHPHDMLRELARGFRNAARNERVPFELEKFIVTDIAGQIDQIADSMLPGPGHCGIVEIWVSNFLSSGLSGPSGDVNPSEPSVA